MDCTEAHDPMSVQVQLGLSRPEQRSSTMLAKIENNDALQIENEGLRQLLAKAGIDATDSEIASQLQRLLLEETHHRVKNTLATAIAITSQSLRKAESLEKGRLAVESRLAALGRAHDLMLRANWTATKLDDIIDAAIQPFDPDHKRFLVQSVDVNISAAAVMPLAMFLNELCTNAIKYGALLVDEGRVTIMAAVEEKSQRFNLRWSETGGPKVREPTRHGFGTQLVNRLAKQLCGDVRLKYEHQGVLCELSMPLISLRPSTGRKDISL
jgi:two-component sensor histidine kinase